MINEVSIGVSLLPDFFWLRFGAFFSALALLIHVACMATKMEGHVPWTLATIMGLSAMFSLGVILGSLSGDIAFLTQTAIVTIGVDTLRQLWLWAHGMHVNEFLKKKYSES